MGLFDSIFGGGDQTVTNETRLPPYIEEASKRNIKNAVFFN